ncbi:Outer membrane protein TolC (TolC) (PDB:1EK9) [Commensalibacter communis]|uniref:Outer membrane protein TolC (TolC) n=1 Tax=Commensalibacter communis TaxID=2972786 RepID=A0A9W4XHM5_9PROT|nr:efflux transporter outer membrane subunit [Commensalibacter communis]CAI3937442.1 Outer membrane protein TolC (TolC) (PDB:1EK9) [Commensalibacter communis]CAI3942879.1 Outer membrane protein TolC (TolC) (PDB:1EK9) [Commensalibacter communis]CAI3943781.1 Outer membrane protein TolC (TolC) (PDB:1EK9) [Commensalibacter communis]CAI3945986.1 Outer membrane protein TolC (TolC) (PDB:1EK9) [Commensalibacter communis]
MVVKNKKAWKRSMQGAMASLFVVSLTACTLSPDYKRPASSVAQEWPIGPAYGAPLTEGAKLPQAYNVGWKVFFRDPVLSQLIALALTNNRDLREAIENITATHASYIQQRGELFPQVNANAGASYQTSPGKTFGVGGATSIHANSLSTGLGISNYEIDLFDRIRSLTRAAREQYLAQQESTISVQISLIGEVANNYMAWLADMNSLQTVQESVRNREKNLALVQGMNRYGQQNAQAVAQAVELLQEAKSQEQTYLKLAANDLNSLTQLVGQPIPQSLLQQAGPNPSLDHFVSMPEVGSGMPSDLLERRPDIRLAEHQLKEANANVGFARSAFFPSIQLTTSGGTAGSTFAQMFGPYSAAWSVMPTMTVPLLDWGKNIAQLRAAKAKVRAAAAHYQSVVQVAFKEVADSLAARTTLKQKWQAELEAVRASQKDYNISLARYKNGIDSFLPTLVAQRTLLTAKVTAIQSRLQYMQSLSTLYRTLGGGWSAENAFETSIQTTQNTAQSPVIKK